MKAILLNILLLSLIGCISNENPNESDNFSKANDVIAENEKLCLNNNDLKACEKLADGFYAKNDFIHATPLYEKVCNEGGAARTCQNAAAAYMIEEGVDRDLVKANSYAKKGCSLNFQPACKVLEVIEDVQNNHNDQKENMKCVMTGVYAPTNETAEEREYRLRVRNIEKTYCLKYIANLDEGCSNNQYGACFMLGLEYDKNPVQAVRTNKAKAKKLYQKACNGTNGKVHQELCADIDKFLFEK